MAARAIWKGSIVLGEERIPVKLYSAVEDKGVHFRLLHEKDGVPVKQVMVNPETGDRVDSADTLRGYETGDGHVVLLDDEDLAAIEPEASRDIEVLRFVEPTQLSHPWYDRPYYLGPDGDGAALEAWSALAAALEESGLEGVVRWTMRKRLHQGALRVHDGIPMLVTLRSAAEVVPVEALDPPEGRPLEAREVEMAERLVEMLEGPLEPEQWEDTYRLRVMELVEAKAEGKTVSIEEYRPRREEASLEDALAASLEAAGAGKERKRA